MYSIYIKNTNNVHIFPHPQMIQSSEMDNSEDDNSNNTLAKSADKRQMKENTNNGKAIYFCRMKKRI